MGGWGRWGPDLHCVPKRIILVRSKDSFLSILERSHPGHFGETGVTIGALERPLKRKYVAADIQVLRGLEPVRKRPGMYTDTSCPNHLIYEVVDNSADEAIVGHAERIEVTLHKDGSVTVQDDGRGMPVDEHPEEGTSGVELILGRLHAGGKFTDGSYRFSGGLHGVGVSVVNALSESLEAWIRRDGHEYHIGFRDGTRCKKLRSVRRVGQRNHGTKIRFRPRAEYFDSVTLDRDKLRHVLRAKAVLCPGLKVSLHEEGSDSREWCYRNGFSDYLEELLPEDVERIPQRPVIGQFPDRPDELDERVDWALYWHPSGSFTGESYVNLVPTPQGGSHVAGLRQGIAEALRGFCERRGLLPKRLRLGAEDSWHHCTWLLSVRLREPRFTGQTKERLSSRECTAMVASAVRVQLGHWLHAHVQTGERLARLAIERAQQRRNRAEGAVPRKRAGHGPTLPGKLCDCIAQDVARTELFLVEGDSAGGSARQARDPRFQAVMPLRGKILNSWDVASDELLSSREVRDIILATGVTPGSTDLAGLRYGKICILADADSDGLHIATLLCALFLRHFRLLVERGHVFVAMPPLYRIDAGKEVHYALDDNTRDRLVERLSRGRRRIEVGIQRFKGLGEMNALQLRETTIAPETRRLVQLILDDSGRTVSIMDMLLARKRSADRRQWLEEKGHLAGI